MTFEDVAALWVEEDDEETAIEEGLREIEEGKGRPFAEFAQEFSARFKVRYGVALDTAD